ncbi:MAG: 2-hydroxyacid dehydrogenase [Geminicoccaceae bacterium]|nr:2-hydroxyacid dehydrogenase [Geminicoccaceae bacterium]
MTKLTVIGDRFMKPELFVGALERIEGVDLDVRTVELPWPDRPMRHGEKGTPLEGLKEFIGEPEDLVAPLEGAEILVTHVAPVNAWLLDRCPDLKLVAVSRGGPVNVDVKAAKARGVAVVNAPGRNASAVAEFTIAAIISMTRLITEGHVSLSRGEWRGDLYRADTAGPELSELVVGLIGYGHIGTRVVRLLKPFGPRILVCDPYVEVSAEDRADGVEQVDLNALLERADVVSLHPRVTPETTGMIGAAALARMKPGAYLVNTARGPLMDYEAVTAALQSKRLKGAMLETFWQEPPPADHPLLSLPNVTLTPHIAGASLTTVRIAARMAAVEVGRYLRGEPFLNPCV